MDWFKCGGEDFLSFAAVIVWTKERPAPVRFMRAMAAAICSAALQADYPERNLAAYWCVSRHTVRAVKRDIGWVESGQWQDPRYLSATKIGPTSDHQGDPPSDQPTEQNQPLRSQDRTKIGPRSDQDRTKIGPPRARAFLREEERDPETEQDLSSKRESEPTPAPKAEQRRRGFFTPPRDLPPEPRQVDVSKPELLPPHQRINLCWNDSLIAAGIRSRYITREINAPVDSRLTEDPDETCRLIPTFIRLATTTAGGWIRAPAPRWDAFVERWAGELSAWDGDENHAPGCGRKLDEVRRGRDNRSPIEREQAIAAHEPEDPDWHLRELPWTTDPPAGTATPLPRTTSHTALRPV